MGGRLLMFNYLLALRYQREPGEVAGMVVLSPLEHFGSFLYNAFDYFRCFESLHGPDGQSVAFNSKFCGWLNALCGIANLCPVLSATGRQMFIERNIL